eukprot:COSAG01_NODE_62960_length_282_cov_0.710383_1_plen_45_part_01
MSKWRATWHVQEDGEALGLAIGEAPSGRHQVSSTKSPEELGAALK